MAGLAKVFVALASNGLQIGFSPSPRSRKSSASKLVKSSFSRIWGTRGRSWNIFALMTAAFTSIVLLLASASVSAAKENRSCALSTAGVGVVRVHGRLAVYNGGYPNFRLWQVGTHHLFGIYGDQADLQCQRGSGCSGDGDTGMPPNVQALFTTPDVFKYFVYGNFHLRLLEPRKEGHMQAACIINANQLVRRLSR